MAVRFDRDMLGLAEREVFASEDGRGDDPRRRPRHALLDPTHTAGVDEV